MSLELINLYEYLLITVDGEYDNSPRLAFAEKVSDAQLIWTSSLYGIHGLSCVSPLRIVQGLKYLECSSNIHLANQLKCRHTLGLVGGFNNPFVNAHVVSNSSRERGRLFQCVVLSLYY
jgi:hypothetical protein